MKKEYPPGMLKFLNDLDSKVREKGTDTANMDCEECGQRILLAGPTWVSMHVFVYPDEPYHTTKALCFNCMNKALKEHGGKQVSHPLN